MASIDEVLSVATRIEANQKLDHDMLVNVTVRQTALESRVGAIETQTTHNAGMPGPMTDPPLVRAPMPSLTREEKDKETPTLAPLRSISRSNLAQLVALLAIFLGTLANTCTHH